MGYLLSILRNRFPSPDPGCSALGSLGNAVAVLVSLLVLVVLGAGLGIAIWQYVI